jgi:hypothetical protein
MHPSGLMAWLIFAFGLTTFLAGFLAVMRMARSRNPVLLRRVVPLALVMVAALGLNRFRLPRRV